MIFFCKSLNILELNLYLQNFIKKKKLRLKRVDIQWLIGKIIFG